MSVLKIVAPIAGLIKIRSTDHKADIDSPFFKLHYRATTTICLLSSMLVTSNGLIGKTIDCMSDTIPGNVMNTYCWIMSTFSIPGRNAVGQGVNYAYQGVQPIDGVPEEDHIRHAYYQWVPFVLALQGFLFYLPHFIWKTYEGQKLTKMTNKIRGRTLKLDDRKSACATLVNYIMETKGMYRQYATVYFICDFLNFINVVGQMYFLNMFLGGVFLTYGTEVIAWADSNPEDRTDPLIEVFPRLTKCTFHKYGHSGTIEKHDALCLLALNIISEKIFVFLWFWLIIIAIATALYIVYQIGVVMIPGMRKFMLEKESKGDSDQISLLMKKADIGDWFVIFLISKNLDSIMFNEFLTQLTEELKTKVHD